MERPDDNPKFQLVFLLHRLRSDAISIYRQESLLEGISRKPLIHPIPIPQPPQQRKKVSFD